MAVGKNKRLTKGKKGLKKKLGDPFLKKEWYDVKAPTMFSVRTCGKTLVSRTQGTKISTEQLKGRVLELNLADLNADDDQGLRKIKLCIEDVQGRNALTDFHGMSLTRNHICSLVKKWQTLVEAQTDVKTSDGYTVRLFCLAFTRKPQEQIKNTTYAQTGHIKRLRKMMRKVMQDEGSKVQLRELVKKFIPESIGKEIEKRSLNIFPLKDCHIRKAKVIKKPKFDITRLMELHEKGAADDPGAAMARPEEEAAQNVLTAEVTAATAEA